VRGGEVEAVLRGGVESDEEGRAAAGEGVMGGVANRGDLSRTLDRFSAGKRGRMGRGNREQGARSCPGRSTRHT